LYHHRWADRRALPLHLFYSFTLVALLISICCILFKARILLHLLPNMSRVSIPIPNTIVCCLASLASRSTSLGFVVISISSGYVGLVPVSFLDNVVGDNHAKLLQLKFDVG
jgi:hypothetical protein